MHQHQQQQGHQQSLQHSPPRTGLNSTPAWLLPKRDGSPLGQAAHAGVNSTSAGYFDNMTTQFTGMSVAGSDRVGGGP